MYTLEELYTHFEEFRQNQVYGNKPKALYEPVDYLMDLGGKRMRPVLLLAALNLMEDEIEKGLNAALAVEVFHNFTLAHDDIMDDAQLRRNKPTMHALYDVNTAILSGDVMLIKSYQYLQNYPPEVIKVLLRLFNKTAVEVCEGQRMDMDFEEEEDVTILNYLEMIKLKTSVLVAAALKMGCILGKGKPIDADHIYEFGKNMGIAFQIQDDLLDTYGETHLTGKEVGGDIRQNKKTYLYLKALELLSDKERAELQLLYKSVDGSDEKVRRVTAFFDHCHVKVHAQELKDVYHQLALSHLDAFGVDADRKHILREFAEKLLNRQS